MYNNHKLGIDKIITGFNKEAVIMEQVRFKQEEIKKILNDNSIKIKNLIVPTKSLENIKEQINAILVPMNAIINKKVLELASLITKKQPEAPAKDHHLSPRTKKDNRNLPEFWRKNLDYGESPYMHLDKIKTITDRPKLSKRKK